MQAHSLNPISTVASVPLVITALILSAAMLAQDLPDGPRPYQPTTTAKGNGPVTPATGGGVGVDAYRRDYEGPKNSQELTYDSGIFQAYASKENQIGNMEGSWVVTAADGRKLVGLELRSENMVSGRLEGAWRSMLAGFGMNSSGFVSDITLTGRDLEVNYFVGGARSPTILNLHKDADQVWRGYMLDTKGEKTPVVLTQVRPGA